MIEVSTMEEMLNRWNGIECQCDPDVGFLCEVCHDTQVVRNAIKERDQLQSENKRLRKALDKYADERNWFIEITDDGWDMSESSQLPSEPWKIAQEALKGREGDDE